MQAITTILCYKKEAMDAVDLYVSLFDSVFGNSRTLATTHFGKEEIEVLRNVPEIREDEMPGPAGSVKTVRFMLNRQEFVAVNGGGYFGKFSESMSIYVRCKTQDQIDRLWQGLSEEGIEQPCGWVRDKYSVSWQIAPEIIWEIAEGRDKQRAQRVMKAIYNMKRIDIRKVEVA
jgi:predicted 3-demethylubiquinone-9 3-methyltransferase (glyoxalase superfamily)